MNTHVHGDQDGKGSCCGSTAKAATEDAGKVIDPVCGMTVDPATAKGGSAEHAGTTYHFCSQGCHSKFIANPQQYLGDKPPPVEAPAGTMYTCPMHPQIRQEGPGTCPICGMALEPEMPSLEEEANPELIDFSRRFWWTLPLSVTVFLLAMFGHYIPALPVGTRTWLEFALSTPVVLWAGWPFLVRCVQSIRTRNPNMWTLIGIGVTAAYAYSVVATVAPGLFPESFREHGRVGVYFEAAAVIISLTLLGQLLELRARSKTGAAIKALLGLAPKTARRVLDDGSEQDIPLDHVHVGYVLRVRPGEKVPVDGSPTLRKALANDYPELGHMTLEDYRVRVLGEDVGTGATVRVLLTVGDLDPLLGRLAAVTVAVPTPATCAGIAFISTLDGYAALPPGT